MPVADVSDSRKPPPQSHTVTLLSVAYASVPAKEGFCLNAALGGMLQSISCRTEREAVKRLHGLKSLSLALELGPVEH
jgi:hypothetical protein